MTPSCLNRPIFWTFSREYSPSPWINSLRVFRYKNYPNEISSGSNPLFSNQLALIWSQLDSACPTNKDKRKTNGSLEFAYVFFLFWFEVRVQKWRNKMQTLIFPDDLIKSLYNVHRDLLFTSSGLIQPNS